MYEVEHARLIKNAAQQVNADLQHALPLVGPSLINWIASQHPSEKLAHPRDFPFFLIPWWVEKEIRGANDPTFQSDLAYASVAAYLHIRLVDNIMDRHATTEYQMVGAIGVFHILFQTIYQRYFPHEHPFWTLFHDVYSHAVDFTIKDSLLTDKTETQFIEIISKKTSFAIIPLAATCYHYDRPDLIAPWSAFIEQFSRWHLMEEDVFDFLTDLKNNTPTFFLCEARRRKLPDERVEAWIIREGLDWAFKLLGLWMAHLRAEASDNKTILAYLETRQANQLERRQKMASGLQTLSGLLSR